MHTVTRYHDICAGHRVVGHENKCRHLHGHNYRIHFTCVAEKLDNLGRVVDFGVVKERLCMWVEENWDHKFLHWQRDPMINCLVSGAALDESEMADADFVNFVGSLVELPFNPTAENMAEYLVEIVGPAQLAGTGVELVSVTIDETAKCSATYTKETFK